MRQTTLLVLGFLSLSAPSALAQADFLPSDAVHAAGLVKYWQLQLPLEPGETVENAYKVDDHLYLATSAGYAFAVHAPTGAIRWLQLVTKGGYPISRPAHTLLRSRDPRETADLAKARHMTIFATPAEMLQVDRYTGTPIRLVDLSFPAGSGPAASGSIVVVGGINRRVYALPADFDFTYWKFLTHGEVRSQPIIRGRYLYVASDAGDIYCCRVVDKTRIWAKKIRGSIQSDLLLEEAGLFVPGLDHSLYLLDPQTGGLRWQARMNGALYEPPVVTADTAYQYNAVDGLVAIKVAGSGEEGRIRWKLARGRSMLAADEQHAFVLGADDSLMAVRLDSGAVEHTVPAAGMRLAMPDPQDQLLLMASQDGRIFCARPKDAEPLSAAQVNAALFVATQPTTQPTEIFEKPAEAPAPPAEVPGTIRPGPPVGGKSRISREFGSQGSAPAPQP